MSSPDLSSSAHPTNQGLFPGYKHVEQFGPDEDYDEDEAEECFVTLDLGSIDQTLVPSSSSYRVIGLDTSTPLLQIQKTIMKGHFKTLIGTELIFKDVSEEMDQDESEPTSNRNNVRYFTKTDRRVQFREVELKPKSNGSAQERQQQGQHATPQPSLSITKRKASAMAIESLLATPSADTSGEPEKHSDMSSTGAQGKVPDANGASHMGVGVSSSGGGDAMQSKEDATATKDTSEQPRTDRVGNGNSGVQAMDVDS